MNFRFPLTCLAAFDRPIRLLTCSLQLHLRLATQLLERYFFAEPYECLTSVGGGTLGVLCVDLGDRALCSAPDARAYFLLLRQKKVAKEKATPGRRPACGGVPCATRTAGRLRNSGLRPSDSPRRLPPAALRCSALHEGGGKAHRTEPDANGGRSPVGFHLALCVVEQRKTQREKGRGLSEGRSPEFRSPPVAAEQRRDPGVAGRRCGRDFSLLTFFWQDKRK